MKYTVFKGKRGKWGVMSPNGKVSDVFISEQSAAHHAKTCNEGIAPLHEEIERLKAELAEARNFVQTVATLNPMSASPAVGLLQSLSNNFAWAQSTAQTLLDKWASTPQDSASSRDK